MINAPTFAVDCHIVTPNQCAAVVVTIGAVCLILVGVVACLVVEMRHRR